MQYHTIPLWEAMEQRGECPLCFLSRKVEKTELEHCLGESVMESDSRIRTSEQGFCRAHHQRLFLQQNRLGHALLTDSHAKYVLQKIQTLTPLVPKSKRSWGERKSSSAAAQLARALDALTHGCTICQAMETHIGRYLGIFFDLWEKDTAFQALWETSRGVCIPHAVLLLENANKQLSSENEQAFVHSLLVLLQTTLRSDEADLEWFTQKFDYRNEAEPWGNSKDALQRTIRLLRGDFSEKEK